MMGRHLHQPGDRARDAQTMRLEPVVARVSIPPRSRAGRVELAIVCFAAGCLVGIITDAFLHRGFNDTCVPADAVDYRGDLGAWVDATGRVVLISEYEDSIPLCADR